MPNKEVSRQWNPSAKRRQALNSQHLEMREAVCPTPLPPWEDKTSAKTGNVLWGAGKGTPPRITSWLVESSWPLSWFLRSWICGCPSVVLHGILQQWPGTLETCPVLWWLPHLGHKQQLKSSMSRFCSPEVESRVFDFHYLAKIPYSFEISMLFDYSSLYFLPHHWCSLTHWGL